MLGRAAKQMLPSKFTRLMLTVHKKRSARAGITSGPTRWPVLRSLAKMAEVTAKKKAKGLTCRIALDRSSYGGMGVAKPSLWTDLTADKFNSKLTKLFDEHIQVLHTQWVIGTPVCALR